MADSPIITTDGGSELPEGQINETLRHDGQEWVPTGVLKTGDNVVVENDYATQLSVKGGHGTAAQYCSIALTNTGTSSVESSFWLLNFTGSTTAQSGFYIQSRQANGDFIRNAMSLTYTGTVSFAGNVTAYSDMRVKTDIAPISNALELCKQVEGCSYWRTDLERNEIGFLAQELQEVIPEVVNYDEDQDVYSVDYGRMTAVLLEAVKELTGILERHGLTK